MLGMHLQQELQRTMKQPATMRIKMDPTKQMKTRPTMSDLEGLDGFSKKVIRVGSFVSAFFFSFFFLLEK